MAHEISGIKAPIFLCGWVGGGGVGGWWWGGWWGQGGGVRVVAWGSRVGGDSVGCMVMGWAVVEGWWVV